MFSSTGDSKLTPIGENIVPLHFKIERVDETAFPVS